MRAYRFSIHTVYSQDNMILAIETDIPNNIDRKVGQHFDEKYYSHKPGYKFSNVLIVQIQEQFPDIVLRGI